MWFFEICVTHLLGRKYQIDTEFILPKHGILSRITGYITRTKCILKGAKILNKSKHWWEEDMRKCVVLNDNES